MKSELYECVKCSWKVDDMGALVAHSQYCQNAKEGISILYDTIVYEPRLLQFMKRQLKPKRQV